jgi:hypothetical protein
MRELQGVSCETVPVGKDVSTETLDSGEDTADSGGQWISDGDGWVPSASNCQHKLRAYSLRTSVKIFPSDGNFALNSS